MMKFFHVSDLHFGKTLCNVSMTDTDQPFFVEQFLRAVDEYAPDAVVIAGDVYDRKVPSPEAMTLFDRLITELYRRNKYVFVVPGNHDSAVRLSHVSGLLADQRIYISGEVRRELIHVRVPGDGTDVVFWLMPYLFPKLVSDERVLNDPDITSYDEAVRALLGAQEIDETACNVLVAHQNVLADGVPPEHSDSETIIGGLGEIDYRAFDAFDYVALGHIHNAQKVGRETVRYAGCPLYYDFSEIGRDKAICMVTIRAKDDISVSRIEIPLRHRLLQLSGTLSELLDAGSSLEDRDRYYIQCVLRDKYVPSRTLEQLREVYGENLVNVKRELKESSPEAASFGRAESGPSRSLTDEFSLFFREQNQELPDGDQEELLRRIAEQQSRQGEAYITELKALSEKDSQELIDFLLKAASEEDA